jgi:signal transduction histidine kinase
LNDISSELREISHDLHPAILSSGGLGPPLKTLDCRSTIPVTLELAIDFLDGRLRGGGGLLRRRRGADQRRQACADFRGEAVGAAEEDRLCLAISDDGVGGADCGKGYGLIGLFDRIEALGGRIRIDSPPGGGTALNVAIPLVDNARLDVG